MTEREVLTYEDFGIACRELAQGVADSGFVPDLVLAIARGGLGLGMGLGYALSVKNLSVVNVEFLHRGRRTAGPTDHAAAHPGRR